VQAYENSFRPTGCFCPFCKTEADYQILETSDSAAIEQFWIQPAVIDQMCSFWARSSKDSQPPNPPPSLKVSDKEHALPVALEFESGPVSLDASLFFEWRHQTLDNPPLDEFCAKVDNMPKRVRLYWSRYFEYVSSSTAPSPLQVFTGTQEIMRVCPNSACGLPFRQESYEASSNTTIAFLCPENCLCDHSLDGLCVTCHQPFQSHAQIQGSARKCATGSIGMWQHQIDMVTECPYCKFLFCEKCFLPWTVASSDGSKAKTHAGLLCPTFKGIVDNDCDEVALMRIQQIDLQMEKKKHVEKKRQAAIAKQTAKAAAAEEEARLLAQSGTKDCPRCGYGPVVHDRGHHCHHVSCSACGHRFCFCCLGTGLCGCPLFCNELCDCPPCYTCRFQTPCELCEDDNRNEYGASPYHKMPAKDVAAFEARRQQVHEAAVQEKKEMNPQWAGAALGRLWTAELHFMRAVLSLDRCNHRPTTSIQVQ
jgi:hypothetical protein